MDCGALRMAGRAAGTTGATAAMNCDPAELASLSRCHCLGGHWRRAWIYSLCQWANNLTPFFFALDGSLREWDDTNGNHSGILGTIAEFRAVADYPSVDSITFTTAFDTTIITGLQELPSLEVIIIGTGRFPTLDCTGLTSLRVISVNTNFFPHSELSSVTLEGCSAMERLSIRLQSITSIDISPSPLLNFLLLDQNLLTATAVDDVLHNLVLHGQTGGYLLIDGAGNAAPTAAGLADKATLEALVPPWEIYTN